MSVVLSYWSRLSFATPRVTDPPLNLKLCQSLCRGDRAVWAPPLQREGAQDRQAQALPDQGEQQLEKAQEGVHLRQDKTQIKVPVKVRVGGQVGLMLMHNARSRGIVLELLRSEKYANIRSQRIYC